MTALLNPFPTVLHIVASLDIGGTEKQLYLVLKYLDRESFNSKVLALSAGGYWTGPIRDLGIELVELERRGSFEIRRLLELWRTMRGFRPDIVHTWHPGGNFYGGLAASLGGYRRLVLSYRSRDRQRRLRAVAETVMFRRASAVVCNSQGLAMDLERRDLVRGSAPTVVYNGMEPSSIGIGVDSEATRLALRSELGLPAHAPVVATVGRMVPFKNQAFLIEVAAEVLRQRPDCFFLFIGDGPERPNLEALALSLGVSEHVLFLGQRTDVAALLHACDLFAFPSGQIRGSDGVAGEGFPNAVMEAMDAGLPCVASTVCGAAELFSDGEAGFLVSPDDKPGFAQAMLQLLQDPTLRSAIGSRGRDIIRERFSAESMARQMAELYKAALVRC